MNLLNEIITSAKNPFSIKSFYVLFLTAFVLLLLPLTTLAVISQTNFFTQAKNFCAVPAEKTFTGTINKDMDGEHVFTFKGKSCNLTAWVNASSNADVSLWIYKPDNSIEVADENISKSYEFLTSNKLAEEGAYRLAVRTNSEGSTQYTATISFR